MYQWSVKTQKDPRGALRRLAVYGGLAALGALGAFAPAFADEQPDGAELATAFGMLIVMAIFFAIAGLAILWAWKNGEFAEPEDVKYQMLAMADDEVDYWDLGPERDDFDDDDDPIVPPTPPTVPHRELIASGAH